MLDSQSYIHSLLETQHFVLVARNSSLEKVITRICDEIAWGKKEVTGIISVVGGAASGKSTLTKHLVQQLEKRQQKYAIISTDDFLIATRAERKTLEGQDPKKKYDFNLMKEIIAKLLVLSASQKLNVPVYNESNGAGFPKGYCLQVGLEQEQDWVWPTGYLFQEVNGHVDFIIIEGDFPSPVNPDYTIYLHLNDELRLKNRIRRDLERRQHGQYATRKEVIQSFAVRQKAQHFPYTLPCVQTADVLLWAWYEEAEEGLHSVYYYDVYENRHNTLLSEENAVEKAPLSVNWQKAPRKEIVAHKGVGMIEFVRLFSSHDFETNTHFVDYAVLSPGSSVGSHTHYTSEELYFILEGTGIMVVNGESFRVQPGDTVKNPLGGTHSLINDSEATLRMLVVEIGQTKGLEAHSP